MPGHPDAALRALRQSPPAVDGKAIVLAKIIPVK
jgi:hypothetical protein